VPIQLPQSGSVGWPFPMLKYKYYFSNKIYGSNLYPRDAMLARVLAIALYPSVGVCVCLSVCLSQVGVLLKWLTDRAGFWRGGFFRPVLHCVLRKFRYLQNKGTSLWNFFLNSGLRKYRHSMSKERAINLAREM